MSTEIAKQKTQAERFTAAVLKEIAGNTGMEISKYQEKLCNNYFIKLNQVLTLAETKRLSKHEKDRDPLPVTWESIDMAKLAVDVMAFCKVGLDPTLANQLSLIPFKNTRNNKYDIVFLIGYKGCELKARKYGFDVPDDVVVELVYSTDRFKQIKRDANNPVEGYQFEVTDDFNRGKIIGGFYYYKYFEKPEKNRLRVFNMQDILKRKPKYASTEFWGGEKEVWKDGKKTKETETVEGWLPEMAYKTLYRAAYDAITIDSLKIDAELVQVLQKDKEAMYGTDTEEVKEVTTDRNSRAIGFDKPIEIKQQAFIAPEQVAEINGMEPAEEKQAVAREDKAEEKNKTQIDPGF